MVAGGGNALVVQLLGNGLDAVARYVETEDLPYDFGVLLDDDDLVRVLILEVFLKCYIGIINIDMMPIDTRHFEKKGLPKQSFSPDACLPACGWETLRMEFKASRSHKGNGTNDKSIIAQIAGFGKDPHVIGE